MLGCSQTHGRYGWKSYDLSFCQNDAGFSIQQQVEYAVAEQEGLLPIPSPVAAGLRIAAHPPHGSGRGRSSIQLLPRVLDGQPLDGPAASRIPSAACGTRARHGVRCVLGRPGFPWVEARSSSGSAEADAPGFAAFPGTTASSDFFQPCIPGFGFLLPHAVPPPPAGPLEDLPGFRPKACGRAWVLGHRGARRHLTPSMPARVPSAALRASAPRILVFSVLLSPAHPYRYRRFACPLAGTTCHMSVAPYPFLEVLLPVRLITCPVSGANQVVSA